MNNECTSIPVSVLVPTRNEEQNLEACLACLERFDEVVVFDSNSTDHTIELAEKCGARIVQREFDDFPTHKNWALENIPFRHEWVLIVDADEQVEYGLADEINKVVSANNINIDGYFIARKNIFAGVWVRHGGWYPDWQLRLFRRGQARYESRIVHEHMLLNGKAGYLANHMVHHDFKGIERYFDRHNTYSSMEAVEAYRALKQLNGQPDQIKSSLFSKGPERRRYLKLMGYRYLPFRPLFKFFWMYIFKGGFLDGRIGFRFCLLHTFYEYQVSLKLEELNNPESPLNRKYRNYIAG
jgi:glycosyltransferase involved in cell wall biosynthesis